MNESVFAVPHEASRAFAQRGESTVGWMGSIANVGVDVAEQLADLNRRTARTVLDEQRAVALEAAGEHSPLGAWRLQAGLALAGIAKAAAYWRHYGDIVLEGYANAVTEVEHGLNDGFMAFTGAVDSASSGAASSLATGDLARATEGIKEAVQIVEKAGREESA